MLARAIRASAGTGKTYALAVHYLALLAEGSRPSQIIATTFTRKAAGEILTRILARLAEAAASDVALQRLNDDCAPIRTWLTDGRPVHPLSIEDCIGLLRSLCNELDRVEISTIDALFMKMLRSLAMDAGATGGPTPIDDESSEARRYRESAVYDALAGLPTGRLDDLVWRLNRGQPKRNIADTIYNSIEALYVDVRSAPDEAWCALSIPEAEPVDLFTLSKELIADAQAYSDQRVRNALKCLAELITAQHWTDVLAATIVRNVQRGLDSYSRVALEETTATSIRQIIGLAASESLTVVQRQTEALRDVIHAFTPAYLGRIAAAEQIPFSEVPLRLANLLESIPRSSLAYHLPFHPQHLLLDEFQDTNREQWEALRSLLPSDTHPESQRSSAFFVGDTKQAIYGWRGGCAAIFDSLNEDVANIHWEQLDQSYRSSQTILEFVDRVFRGLSRSDTLAAYPELLERWKKAYTRSVAAIPRRGLAELIIAPRSVLLSSTADAEPGEDDDSAFTPYESWGVTKILEIIRDHPRSSVGILTRTNKYARRLAIRLMVEGIDASLEGPGTLVDDSAVELVLSAITFADHPGSDAAAFHVFHSPLSAQLGFTEFTDDQRNRTALALRESVIARGWGHTISWLCRLLAPWSDARSARRLSSLVEAADEYDRSPGRRPVEFVDMIRTRTLRDSVPSPVRVMSIHQAKGLEFDVVILPELQRTIPAKTPPVMIVRQTETGPITAIYPYAAESIRACSPELVSAHQRYHQRILGDELNLLYVAMTRPRNALYMLIPPKKLKPDGTASATGKPTLGDIVRGALDIPNEAEDYDHRVGDLDLGGAGDSASDSGPMIEQVAPERVVFACRSPRRRWPDLSPSSAAREHTDAIRSLFGMNRDARDRGTLLHGWLQQIEWIEDGVPGTDQLLDIARITLPHRKPEWAEGFLEDYHRMLRSPAVTATLSRPGIEAVLFREHAITARIRGSLVRGRVDRMVVTREPTGSVATITDFKTDMIGADAVATRAELLAPQIRSYAECVSEVFRIPMERIRSQLLFVQPEIAVTIEVRPSPARPTP